MMKYILILIYTVLGVSGMTMIKLGSQYHTSLNITKIFVGIELSWTSLCGVFLYGINFLLYIYLISKYELSYLFPMLTAMTYIGILAVSTFVFHESFSAIKIVGSLLVFVGVILLNVPNLSE